ncbi:MAG TPA: glycosyltransferase family 4 protein [Gaiellaceae bacterium]|nr:glycosyltransferase family 4 protein [Gaiellaceae bacterium]
MRIRLLPHAAATVADLRMRVGILTQYYAPEMGAVPARLGELATRLRERGHEVVVVSAMPNYPRGEVYPGYGGLLAHEKIDGAVVLRTWIWPTLSASVIPRTLSYLSFAASSLFIGSVRLPRLDVLITESPPLPLGVTGFLLSRLKHARFVFNVSDLWPESAVVLGVLGDGFATKLAYKLERFCYRRAWRVSCQSREIRASIDRRFTSVHTLAFFNGVDTGRFGPVHRTDAARRQLGRSSELIALYAGLHGIAQGLDQLLAAAATLSDENLRLVLVGDGPEKGALLENARERGLGNVSFLPPQPKAAMPALLAAADIAVVTLKTHIPGAVPSKLYEAMASGLPVVLVAEGEAAEILESAGAGLVVKPGDTDGLAAALARLARSPDERARLGAASRTAAVERYDRRPLCDAFIDALESA